MRIPQTALSAKDSYLEIQVYIDINGSIFVDKAHLIKNATRSDSTLMQALLTQDLSSNGPIKLGILKNKETLREQNDLNVDKAKSIRNEIENGIYSIKQSLIHYADYTISSETNNIDQLSILYHEKLEELEDMINDLDTMQQLKINFYTPMQAIESNIKYRLNLVNKIRSLSASSVKEDLTSKLNDIHRKAYQVDSIQSLIELSNELDLLNFSMKNSSA